MKKYCAGHRGFRVFVYGLFLIGGLVSIAKAGAINDYSVKVLPDTAEMVLLLSYPVNYQVIKTSEGRELHFDRAINLSDLKAANYQLSFWVEEISASYDVLQLRLKPNVETDLSMVGYNISIVFRMKQAVVEKNAEYIAIPEKHKTNLALERVNARLAFESGHIIEAQDRYSELLKLHPRNTQLMLGLGGVEEKLHNWREALQLYLQAEELMPYSLSITVAKQNLLRTYGSRMTGSINYRKIGSDNTQVKVGLQGRQLMKSNQVWFVDYYLWNVDNKFATRRINGDLKTFSGQQHDLSLGVEALLFSGEQKISFFAGKKHPGLAWAYQQTGDYGLLGVKFDWHVPWLETSEALAGYGSRDRLAIVYENTFFKKLNVSSTISVNNYGLDEADDTTKSYRLQLGAYYNLQELGQGFSVAYSLDREKVYSQTEKIDSLGDTFILFPLDDREQHVFVFGWENTFDSRYIFQSYIGYEYDRRRSASAPFIRLNLNYRPRPRLEMNVNIESGLSTYNEGSDDFLTLGAGLNWYF